MEPETERRSPDRKSTRLNSSHPSISYAVFCLKKKTNNTPRTLPTQSTTPQLSSLLPRDRERLQKGSVKRHVSVVIDVGLVPERVFFFFNDTAPTEIYTLSLHDALPI